MLKSTVFSLMFAAVSLLLVGSACAARQATVAQPSNGAAVAYAKGRDYLLYSPASLGDRKAPLLLVLHGAFGNAQFIQNVLNIQPVADQYGFRVAYLNGSEGKLRIMKDKRTWNAGICCGIAKRDKVNDVGYIAGVIESLTSQGLVEPRKVVIMGHSNGAMMSYRFACTQPGMVSGVVAISGVLALNQCPSAKGVRVLHIHGEADEHIPYRGGAGKDGMEKLTYRSTQQTVQAMQQAGAASTELISLPGVPHKLETVAQAVRSYKGVSLAETVAQFLMQ